MMWDMGYPLFCKVFTDIKYPISHIHHSPRLFYVTYFYEVCSRVVL